MVDYATVERKIIENAKKILREEYNYDGEVYYDGDTSLSGEEMKKHAKKVTRDMVATTVKAKGLSVI